MKKQKLTIVLLLIAFAFSAIKLNAQNKPNILVIWGDDIGKGKGNQQ